MARLFGFLMSHADSTRAEAEARYAAAVTQGAPGGGQHRRTLQATGNVAVCCHAPHVLEIGGVSISVAGDAIWQGTAITTDNGRRVLAEIAEQYRSVGRLLLDQLRGQFALSILDPVERRAMLAVDRMGVERLTYVERSGGLAFGTSAYDVAGFPGVTRSFREQALYDFLIFHMVPAPGTVYQKVSKLQPATVLTFEDGKSKLERYWMPHYDYADQSDFPELKAQLHESLTNAVSSTGVGKTTGAFLSGGLDSSSISGALAGVSDSPAKTFSVGFGEAEYDELQFARIANQQFGCESFEYHMKPADIVDVFPRIAATFDEPFGNSSAAPTYFCAKLAADNGVNHLLAGDGGDEVFGGNERYVRHRIFELYGRIPRWLRKGFVEPSIRLVSPDSRITPLRKARSYVDQAMIPLPERFESWNLTYREGGEQMLTEQFATAVDKDGPFQVMRNVWSESPSDNLLERMLWYDWHFTLADNDLRKVGTMCELAGVKVSYPLLHDSIVSLSNRVPPSMKIRGTELRVFFKNAMKGFLPDDIINKKKHGFGLPFGLWLKTDQNLQDLIFSYLTDLKKRQLIRPDFIEDLIVQHRTGHASYYGYVLWDLAMLEAWMGCHENAGEFTSSPG